jgi:hypothetical protein
MDERVDVVIPQGQCKRIVRSSIDLFNNGSRKMDRNLLQRFVILHDNQIIVGNNRVHDVGDREVLSPAVVEVVTGMKAAAIRS